MPTTFTEYLRPNQDISQNGWVVSNASGGAAYYIKISESASEPMQNSPNDNNVIRSDGGAGNFYKGGLSTKTGLRRVYSVTLYYTASMSTLGTTQLLTSSFISGVSGASQAIDNRTITDAKVLYTAAAVTTKPGGGIWSQNEINSLQFQFVAGSAVISTLRVHEVWVGVVYSLGKYGQTIL